MNLIKYFLEILSFSKPEKKSEEPKKKRGRPKMDKLIKKDKKKMDKMMDNLIKKDIPRDKKIEKCEKLKKKK